MGLGQNRLQDPFTRLRFKLLNKIFGEICGIQNQKSGHAFEEMQRPATPLLNIKAYLSVTESFGFCGTLRAATSGQAFPTVRGRPLGSSDPVEAGPQAAQLVADIRKRKGLKEQMSPLSKYEDKL